MLKCLKEHTTNIYIFHIERSFIKILRDLFNNELVPNTYDYTKLFGQWKGKGSKLDLNMTRYIHGKEWDAKFLEALVSERMKALITKHCPKMQIGGMKGNSSSEHLIVVKIWMKTNETGNKVCI